MRGWKRLRPAELPLNEEQRQGRTITVGNTGQRLRVRALSRDIDGARRLCFQTVEFTLYGPDGAVLRRSEERLSVGWFEDAEIERAANDAWLRVVRTEVDFDPAAPTPRPQKVYVLEPRGSPASP